MDEVKINTSKTLTLTLPSDPTSNLVSVSLYHEFGNLVSGPTSATRTGTGVYTIAYGQQASGIYILNSAGRHRADFTYTIAGTSYTQSQYINVFTPYITASEFFDNHPELEDSFSNVFENLAKKARNIIDTFCGQSFDYYPAKTMYIYGNGYQSMRLPLPISVLTEIIQDEGREEETVLVNATTDSIEKLRQPFNFEATYQIKFRKSSLVEEMFLLGKFHKDSLYKITGDFGWRFVPDNIKQASILLIADMMNNDSEYRNHGIVRVEMDAIRLYMKDSFYESTGNIEADVLLMDYTLFVMDYIV
jgi:hypothetical protein